MDEIREMMKLRLAVLKPRVDEYDRLSQAEQALSKLDTDPSAFAIPSLDR